MEKLNEQQAARLASLSVKQQTSAADLQRIAVELQLRQWCIEQANVFCEYNDYDFTDDTHFTVRREYPIDTVAQAILDFVTAPLRGQQ